MPSPAAIDPFSRGLKRALSLPLTVVFLTAALLFWMIFALLHLVRQAENSNEVLRQSGLCMQTMLDMETGSRGYLLNGSSLFRQPYEDGLKHVDGDFERLRQMAQNDPREEDLAKDLITAKDLWLQQTQNSLTRKQASLPISDADSKMGKSLMDSIRDKISRFNGEIDSLHAARERTVRDMKWVLFLGSLLLFLLLSLVIGRTMRREFARLGAEHRNALAQVEQRHAALLRSEADLEEQKEWFRVTLSSIGDGVIVTDKEGRIVFLNGEAERLTGWKSVEALLQPLLVVFKIISEETRAKVEDPVGLVLRQKKVVGLANHTLLISKTGHETPIEDSAAPILNTKGEILGVVMVFHDAAQMREAQRSLKARAEELEKKVNDRTVSLQRTVSELESFSYTVSHDLRSPLRAMQGFAQALLEDYGDKLDETGRNYLDRIRNAAERLDHLIQDLLSYTRMSRQDAPLIELDLDKVLRDVIEHYPNLRSPAADVEIVGRLPKVWGQEGALIQVCSNLLGNATKFVLPGTHPSVRIWGEDRGEKLRLWIQDNGIGIAPKDVERIFQMFVRVNESQLYSGTGVGLAIVKKAALTLHGDVGVESTGEAGSKFWVDLNKVVP